MWMPWSKEHGRASITAIAVEAFLDKYSDVIGKFPVAYLQLADAAMVFESFGKTKASAAALDGWNPKEFSLLSLHLCAYIAVMLNQIEAGVAWHKSSLHALIAYIEKGWCRNGEGDAL